MRAETINVLADIRRLELRIIAVPNLEDTVIRLGANTETIDLLVMIRILHNLLKDDMIENLLEILM
jgi:hypothetical protein